MVAIQARVIEIVCRVWADMANAINRHFTLIIQNYYITLKQKGNHFRMHALQFVKSETHLPNWDVFSLPYSQFLALDPENAQIFIANGGSLV